MKNSKNLDESIRQNGQNAKKSQKHDANLQKSTILYFQIGLVLCLLGSIALLEMKFETKIPEVAYLPEPEEIYSADVPIVKVKVKQLDKKIATKPKPDTRKYEEVPDETPDIFEELDKNSEPETQPVLNPDAVVVVDAPPTEIPDIPFPLIEHVPVYPGCENKKTNDEKRKCMSEKITKLVQKKFDTDLGGELGLKGKQVIQTQFKIDKTGRVTDVKVRGPHKELEKEAMRVIHFIPEMTPGKQRDRNVGVIYNLPIIFQVQN